MKMVIEIKGGMIVGIVSTEPVDVLVLDYDVLVPGIDDEPEETVIDYNGDEVVCYAAWVEIQPMHAHYFFAVHDAQYGPPLKIIDEGREGEIHAAIY